jgi:hypothetical protein
MSLRSPKENENCTGSPRIFPRTPFPWTGKGRIGVLANDQSRHPYLCPSPSRARK